MVEVRRGRFLAGASEVGGGFWGVGSILFLDLGASSSAIVTGE